MTRSNLRKLLFLRERVRDSLLGTAETLTPPDQPASPAGQNGLPRALWVVATVVASEALTIGANALRLLLDPNGERQDQDAAPAGPLE